MTTVKKISERHYKMYRDSKSKWRWTFVARNGKKRGDSGEGYTRKIDCLRSIRDIADSSGIPIISAGE